MNEFEKQYYSISETAEIFNVKASLLRSWEKEFEQLKVEFKRLTATPFNASQWLRGENGVAAINIEREDVKLGRVSLVLFSNKDIAGGISSYEVINQIKPDAITDMRGDVTLLVNGLPVIHVESLRVHSPPLAALNTL